jgi:hypothetical protein
MPVIDDVLAIATAASAIATWFVPPVRYLLSFRRKPRDSLAVVGRVIGLFVLAGLLSAIGLVLAILRLAFSDRTGWGWFGLGTIAMYWFTVAVFAVIADHTARRRQRQLGRQIDWPQTRSLRPAPASPRHESPRCSSCRRPSCPP